jgi:hypothetical protein
MTRTYCSKAISLGGKEEMGMLDGVPTSSDTEIIGINRRSVFSLAEARTLLPLISRMTKTAADKVQVLIAKIEAKSRSSDTDRAEIEVFEAQASQLIQDWQTKIQKLGGLPKGIWVVDFRLGRWLLSAGNTRRSAIDHWHAYRDGYTKRKKVGQIKAFAVCANKFVNLPGWPRSFVERSGQTDVVFR